MAIHIKMYVSSVPDADSWLRIRMTFMDPSFFSKFSQCNVGGALHHSSCSRRRRSRSDDQSVLWRCRRDGCCTVWQGKSRRCRHEKFSHRDGTADMLTAYSSSSSYKAGPKVRDIVPRGQTENMARYLRSYRVERVRLKVKPCKYRESMMRIENVIIAT